MNRKYTFTLSFKWSSDAVSGDDTRYDESLMEAAQKRAFEQIQEGMREGELCEDVRFGYEDEPEDGHQFRGWCSFKEVPCVNEVRERALQLAAGNYLTEPLPANWKDMEEAESLAFIEDHKIELVERGSAENIYDNIIDAAELILKGGA